MADAICTSISTTTSGLDKIAKQHGVNPDSIYTWLRLYPDFSEKYARARRDQLQILADQLIELSDTDRICQKVTTKADGTTETVTLDQVERTKLQIDTRKWLLSKLDPKKYGDKIQNEHTGAVQLVNSIPRPKRD